MFYEKIESEDDLKSNIEEMEVDEMVSFHTKKRLYLCLESY